MSFAPTKAEREQGWPRRLCDVKGLRVRLRRDVHTGSMTMSAGLAGTLGASSTSWTRLWFDGDRCECCGVGGRVSNLSRRDLDVIEPKAPDLLA